MRFSFEFNEVEFEVVARYAVKLPHQNVGQPTAISLVTIQSQLENHSDFLAVASRQMNL